MKIKFNDAVNTTIFLCIIVIISLCIIWYNTYNYKCQIESFNNYKHNSKYLEQFDNYTEAVEKTYDTTLEAYKKGFNFHEAGRKYLHNFYQFKDVKDNLPLQTYGCIMSEDEILEELQSKFYVSYYDFYSVSANDILEKISEDVERTVTKSNESALRDPIYVVIYQAPYLEFNGEQIIARHDSINNLKASYEQYNEDKQIGQRQLYTKIYIIYANYHNDSDIPQKIRKYPNDEGINQFKEIINPKLTRNKLCFLECNGVNGYACGCLSGANSQYDSKCVELDDKQYNYGMIYVLNRMNKLFTKNIQKYNDFVL